MVPETGSRKERSQKCWDIYVHREQNILAIVKSFNIPSVFPDKVLRQADRVPDHVQEADMDGRLDLRDLVTVTIDGEDAKDLDDAVSLTEVENGWKLGVHIADVTNYVQEKSALDREALKRGTSVYLADRVIPMCPISFRMESVL